MQDIKVALVQADQVWENKQANFANYSKLIQGVNAHLFLLPEMFTTGFSMNVDKLAEPFDKNDSLDWLKKQSALKNAAFYTSLIIKKNDAFYNCGVFVTPDGRVRYYNKRKTFGLAKEDQFFTAGEQETIVDYLGWKFQLQICYDLRFPEIVRNKIDSNHRPAYDVILYVANWPEKRIEHWRALLKARAIENQCYVAAVNRVGKDPKGHTYSGASILLNANGTGTEMKPNVQDVNCFEINGKKLNEIRDSLPFLRDR